MKIINKVSRLFQPFNIISKEGLPETDISAKTFKLLENAGIISNSSTGMYTFLPLGFKVIKKLTNLVDEEMKNINGQRILLPSLTPSNLWRKTSRFEISKNELFILDDRQEKEYILCPTSEEAITNVISQLGPLKRSQLPLKLYQISSKWRDEMKPRLGLLRSREFIMKDMYTFDEDLETSRISYEIVNHAYENILNRIGIPYKKLKADTGIIGGTLSHEFHYVSDIGENIIYLCDKCDYYSGDTSTNGHLCPKCKNILKPTSSVEVAHTFLLGSKYSEPLKATYINEKNKKKKLEMGCYGIGLTRLMAAAVGILSTNKGIRWPNILAPYNVCILPPKAGSKEESASKLAYDLYFELQSLNIDSIIDDRTEMTIGRRLIDAQFTGYPVVIIIGKKSLKDVPVIEVNELYSKTYSDVKFENTVSYVKKLFDNYNFIK